MHSDHKSYLRFSGPARLEKSVNSLLGLIEGIAADAIVNAVEIEYLRQWVAEHQELRDWHPFSELVPAVEVAISDGIVTAEEHADLTWLCEKLRSQNFFDAVTVDMQRLHGMLGGVIADAQIHPAELERLDQWLQSHVHLKSLWPYDEIESLITVTLADGKIDPDEHRSLLRFFADFAIFDDARVIVDPLLGEEPLIQGLCATCPDLVVASSVFCFTGASIRYKRKEFSALVSRLGGTVSDNVTAKVNYLVIGADGNPCWAYSCYGRKVEQAVKLRKQGARLVLIHENDFHDAIADLS